ncbi:MAG: DMT family transporter [Acidobacteriota bacterium]
MSIRKALDARAVSLMIVFCAILGMQQTAIKAATPDMAPVLQMAIRSCLAALVIGLILRMKGLPLLPGSGKWLPGLAAGILFTVEYLFVAEGLRFTSASHMVTMLYTAPVFAAFGLHFLIPEERLHPMQWGGMALAFCGIAIAFYDNSASSDSILFGDFLGLLAGISWGTTTVVIRTKLSETPSTQTTFVQLLTCFCILLPGAALTGRFDFSMTNIVWTSLAFQILIVCVVGMLLWFWLLTVYPASQLGVLCFLTPVFGIVFGVLLLAESVEPKFILGAILVFAGIVIVSGWQWFAQYVFHKRGSQNLKTKGGMADAKNT